MKESGLQRVWLNQTLGLEGRSPQAREFPINSGATVFSLRIIILRIEMMFRIICTSARSPSRSGARRPWWAPGPRARPKGGRGQAPGLFLLASRVFVSSAVCIVISHIVVIGFITISTIPYYYNKDIRNTKHNWPAF